MQMAKSQWVQNIIQWIISLLLLWLQPPSLNTHYYQFLVCLPRKYPGIHMCKCSYTNMIILHTLSSFFNLFTSTPTVILSWVDIYHLPIVSHLNIPHPFSSCIILQTVPDWRWFHLQFFNFKMVWKWYALSGNHISSFEFRSFPGLAICPTILSQMLAVAGATALN